MNVKIGQMIFRDRFVHFVMAENVIDMAVMSGFANIVANPICAPIVIHLQGVVTIS